MKTTIDYNTLGDEIKKVVGLNSKIRAVLSNTKDKLDYINYIKKHKELGPVLDSCLHNLVIDYENNLLPLKEQITGGKHENLFYKVLLKVEQELNL